MRTSLWAMYGKLYVTIHVNEHDLPNLGTVGEIALILGRSCNVTNNNNDLKFFRNPSYSKRCTDSQVASANLGRASQFTFRE